MKYSKRFFPIKGQNIPINVVHKRTGLHLNTIYQHVKGLRNPTKRLIDMYLIGLGITYDEFQDSLTKCQQAALQE